MGKTKFHWEQQGLESTGKAISFGNMIWKAMGRTISLGTGNGEHDYLIMGKTISLGTGDGEHDYLIMGKTISLGT
jgi:hypothetical protein